MKDKFASGRSPVEAARREVDARLARDVHAGVVAAGGAACGIEARRVAVAVWGRAAVG